MATTTDMTSLETKPINTQATGRRLIARKATAERAIVRKTIAMVATARKTIAMMITVRKAIVVISGNGMTVSDTGTVPTTNRLVSTDRIAGSLTTTRPGRPISLATKTTSPAPTLVMIKMILIPLLIHQSPPLTATRLVWSSASW